MKLTITDQSKLNPDGTAKNAKGGTEMMHEKLYQYVNDPIIDHFQIICSRVRHVDPDKHTLLWLHDTFNDVESAHLKEQKSQDRFHRFIFVSNYQFTTYHLAYGIPHQKSIVLKNAIEPIPNHKKPDASKQLNLIYHTTPHRGLELLVPAFEELYKHFPHIHLDVYSSFSIYGWKKRDEPYQQLFDRCRNHPAISYHGAVSNDEVRKALKKAHIFAYPSIWPETGCIAAMEAMSAGCGVVCPNYAALPETTAGFAYDYQMTENVNDHANRFANQLADVIRNYCQPENKKWLTMQKKYADEIYNWSNRALEWKQFLNTCVSA